MAILILASHEAKSVLKQRKCFLLFTAIFLGMLSCVVQAVTLDNIEFLSLPGDKMEIRMEFDGPPPNPTGYTIVQPARIALDLMNVMSGLDSKHHALGSGNARSVTVIEAGDRTRVIVALTKLMSYRTHIEGNKLFVLVGSEISQAARVGGVTRTQEVEEQGYAKEILVIQDIDFRRGEVGEARILVTMSASGSGVDVSSESGKIRVEITNAHLPQSLQRRLDVTDFATPVVMVDAMSVGENVVLMIKPSGDYDYLAYQADNVFILEVTRVLKGY